MRFVISVELFPNSNHAGGVAFESFEVDDDDVLVSVHVLGCLVFLFVGSAFEEGDFEGH
jgi:hypothetical protein